ncbi:MAG: pre-peptidase C-terminal domain-containing protein [Methylobacter sp.]
MRPFIMRFFILLCLFTPLAASAVTVETLPGDWTFSGVRRDGVSRSGNITFSGNNTHSFTISDADGQVNSSGNGSWNLNGTTLTIDFSGVITTWVGTVSGTDTNFTLDTSTGSNHGSFTFARSGCTAPQVLENGICVTPPPVCIEPQVLENGICVTPIVTPACTGNQILLNNVCVSPATQIATGSFSEPNNSRGEATPILINDQPIFHMFTSPTDTDWFEIYAEAGERYTIDIPGASVGKAINPVIDLYDEANNLLTDQVNNGALGEGEQLQFTAPSTGLFWIRVSHHSSLARATPNEELFKGEAIDYSYQIRVFLTDAPLQPLTKGRTLDNCDQGINGADVSASLGGVSARSTVTNKFGEFGLLLNPGNYELNILATQYQQASQSVAVGQEPIALPAIKLTPTTSSACVGDSISRAQQAPAVYDEQTGLLVIKDVILDGSQVFYVELQNIGDFRFQLTRMLNLPGIIHSNPPLYNSITLLADLPKVFALDQDWKVQMRHIGDGVLPLESAEPY